VYVVRRQQSASIAHLWAHSGTVHDGVATVQLVCIINVLQALLSRLVTRIDDPSAAPEPACSYFDSIDLDMDTMRSVDHHPGCQDPERLTFGTGARTYGRAGSGQSSPNSRRDDLSGEADCQSSTAKCQKARMLRTSNTLDGQKHYDQAGTNSTQGL
jgi:hypothetical protein